MLYHVDSFDVDTVTLFFVMLSFILVVYICISKDICSIEDLDMEEMSEDEEEYRVPTAVAFGFPAEIECPHCNHILEINANEDG